MSQASHPRPAYCEDEYDEDDVTTPIANVAIKRTASITKRASYERTRRNDGSSDSSYSSKTGTNTSTSSIRKDMTNLTIDPSGLDREPQPYACVPRPDAQRRSSSATREKNAVQKARFYVHKKADNCYVCDTWGEHLPEELRPTRKSVVAPSPKATKASQAQTSRRGEGGSRPVRRDSAVRTARPVSMYGSNGPQFHYQPPPTAMHYAVPTMSPVGWPTPMTQTMPLGPPFGYTPAVMSATYVSDGSYFEQPILQENRPSKAERRSSTYGDPIVRQSKAETKPKESQGVPSNRDHIRTNSDRTIRADDYERMPPPPRPTEVTLAHRPSMKKSATYNTPLTASSKRRSQVVESDESYVNNVSAPSPSRERRIDPTFPPSSYHGPADASETRPPNRKSVSYSTPSSTTKVSSSAATSTSKPLPRRSTTSSAPPESKKVVDAEVYQNQRRSLTSTELTAEALLSLKQRNPSSQSESSSHRSHRSHHTKSSSSAGGKSKRSNSDIKMIINGVPVSIPSSTPEGQSISISARKDGDVSISVGGRIETDRESSRHSSQKRIERASSAASRMSSKSISERERHATERARERDRERSIEQYERMRRESQASSRSRSRTDALRRVAAANDDDCDRASPNPWDD